MSQSLRNLLKNSCAALFNFNKRKMFNKGFRFLFVEPPKITLETLNFDDKILKCLPIDENEDNVVKQVKGACYSKVLPTHVINPQLVSYSKSALALLDLSVSEAARKEFVTYFSGNQLLPGSTPLAHCYCGHQFGHFAGQLGDGAAITLGVIINKNNERWEVQLKGAGLTPYSRTADGRKVLRSSIREFLCSEAMYYLNVPTTRASSIITSDSEVVRDVYYDGHPILEKCSIVCRLAPTFIRFGSFQICKGADKETGNHGPSVAHSYILNQLADFVIETYYPEIWASFKDDKGQMYAEFFGEVVRRTAKLVAQWQCLGWSHGVLNTDNMSILGLTIDYGPYGFLDHYDTRYICNASDMNGRYMFHKQPEMCKWNCNALAKSLQVIADMSKLKKHLKKFDEEYEKCYMDIMRKKLGLLTEHESDKDLINSLLETMNKTATDYTNTFVCLSHLRLVNCFGDEADDGGEGRMNFELVKEMLLQQCTTANELLSYYKTKLHFSTLASRLGMLQAEAELGIVMKHQKDYLLNEEYKMNQYLYYMNREVKKKEEDIEYWTAWLNKYINRLKLDCRQVDKILEGSSVDDDDAPVAEAGKRGAADGDGDEFLEKLDERRIRLMKSVNPRFILRNYIAQQAIDAAEFGDYSLVNKILKRLERPFEEDKDDYEYEATAAASSTTTKVCGPARATCDDQLNDNVSAASTIPNRCAPVLKRHPMQTFKTQVT